MSLSDTQRIEILILLGCGDKTRTQKQVCEIFNTKYPDRRISQSTVRRIENKFRGFGNVTDIPKSGRKRILDDEQKLDILLDSQDNPHKPTRQVAADNDVKPEDLCECLGFHFNIKLHDCNGARNVEMRFCHNGEMSFFPMKQDLTWNGYAEVQAD
ncbi:hypothetical protein NQ318_000778 [Aromia moschata]|uniref:DUF4817 domain-containing protein n=1 Tax=Aromia moschata TaxID=1265417 RepID=A0AAV8YTZ6_9CUCU|nr:hypothetical protein NQ318_000778 [Aromia moschata]